MIEDNESQSGPVAVPGGGCVMETEYYVPVALRFHAIRTAVYRFCWK